MRKIEQKLLAAVKLKDLETVRSLLHQGVNTNTARKIDQITPLMIAAKNNDVAMVKLLLQNGAAIEAEDYLGRDAFDYAGKYGAVAVLMELAKFEEDNNDVAMYVG